MTMMLKGLDRFNGTQTLGRGRTFWALFAVTVALLASAPLYAEVFIVSNLAYFLLWTFMALGLSLIWGYAGILSFGQTAFFGLAGYGYGVISINLGFFLRQGFSAGQYRWTDNFRNCTFVV